MKQTRESKKQPRREYRKGDRVRNVFTGEEFVVIRSRWQNYDGGDSADYTVEFEPTKDQPTPWDKSSNLVLVREASKHTPGPWIVHIEKHGGIWQFQIRTETPHNPSGGLGKHIATCNSLMQARGEDNAALIAAAPSLLQTLTTILDRLSTSPMQDDELAAACRAAIAKAEGGAE